MSGIFRRAQKTTVDDTGETLQMSGKITAENSLPQGSHRQKFRGLSHISSANGQTEILHAAGSDRLGLPRARLEVARVVKRIARCFPPRTAVVYVIINGTQGRRPLP